MIKRIRRIKNLRIFDDCSWDPALPDFKPYNLCYGYNGSGKTTLTRLFAVMQGGTTEGFPNLEYEMETDSGTVTQGQAFPLKIRVFNEDYVRDTIYRVEGKTKPIFIVGPKKNKRLAEEIIRDEQLLSQKQISLQSVSADRDHYTRERDTQFTDIARTISALGTGQATRGYNKTKAERTFGMLPGKELLAAGDVDVYRTTLTQRVMDRQKTLVAPQLKYRDEERESDLATFLSKAVTEGRSLCAQTATSIAISRLKENADIANWVEQGIRLHREHRSERCEYCDQCIPDARATDLANHFNQADKELKNDIDAVIAELGRAKSSVESIVPIDKVYLYDELQTSYESSREAFIDARKALIRIVSDLIEELALKKSHTTESSLLKNDVDPGEFITAMTVVNGEIARHNSKTDNFPSRKEVAFSELESHYLSTIYDDIQSLDKRIRGCVNEMETLTQGDPTNPQNLGITAIKDRIAANRAAISSPHKGCAELNNGLKTFLGRDEIVFEAEEDGYVIKRKGKIAGDLSEGERNAIAFVYFTIHLQDHDFITREGIVVVDDPVSSLDSNSLFQAFSFLKNAVQGSHQVFLFTHNFDFLRLLLSWLKHHKRDVRSFYMLHNPYVNGNRVACLAKLDPLLEEHETEYHYLFKRLRDFSSDGTIASVYDVPNIARKVLETFLMFRVPNNGNVHQKLECIDFDERKKTAIYKFVNDQSHMTGRGFDPSLLQEAQSNVAYLLEMIEKVFPEHYKILVDSLGT